MAAVELEFAINRITGQLSSSYLAMVPYALPDLYAGDTLSLRIRLVKPTVGAFPGSLSLISPGGLLLKVGIGTPGTALINFDLAVDGDSFAGEVPLTDPAIAALFAGAQRVNQTIEFRISEAGNYKRVQKNIVLVNAVISAAAVTTNMTEEALGKNEAAASYVPRDGGQNGQWFELKNEAGRRFKIYMGNDDELHAERIV